MADAQELQEVEQWLTTLYGNQETPDKVSHRGRVIDPDGEINAFQRLGLKNMAATRLEELKAQGPTEASHGVAPLPAVAPELAHDIPEPIEGFDDRPDVVGMVKAACRIITAVANWGKPQPNLKIGNRTEGIHVRCPFPNHPDNNPSAWINTAKDTWFCGACQEGGDQIVFYAAAKHGMTQSDLRDSETFRSVIQEMAAELGLDTEPPQPVPVDPPEPEPDEDPDAVQVAPEPEIPAAPDNEPPSGPPSPALAAIDPDDFDPRDEDPLDYEGVLPSYDWRDLGLRPETFLAQWMKHNLQDMYTVPPEYFIMLGFQALGLACGHHLQPVTNRGITNGAFMMLLIGPTGCGKSLAKQRMTKMFESSVGSRWDPADGTGIRVFNTPGSAEAFLRLMRHDIEDPSDPLKKIETPVTALLEEDEFAVLASKNKRPGNEHNKQRFMKFVDFAKQETGPEIVDRDFSISNGSHVVHDAFFSAVMLTQTETIRTQFEEKDMVSGFMNRIIPVFGQSPAKEDPTIDWNKGVPGYAKIWDATWRWIRGNPVGTHVPWEPDVGLYLKNHEYWRRLGDLEQMEGMALLSRMKHQSCRLAFLLAVNEGALVVERRHFEIVLRFMRDYVEKCFARFRQAAKATESKDLKTRILEYLHKFYDRTGEWPSRWELGRNRFWRDATDWARMSSLDNLFSDHQVSELTLKAGTKTSKILVATDQEGYWRQYASHHGKIFPKESFYASAR